MAIATLKQYRLKKRRTIGNGSFIQLPLASNDTQALYNLAALGVMRQRAVRGPWKAFSDLFPNSRGCWNEIVADKNTVMGGTQPFFWSPPPSPSYPVENFDPSEGNGRPYEQRTHQFKRAALYGLVAQDATADAYVKTRLLEQIRDPTLSFKRTGGWASAVKKIGAPYTAANLSDNGTWAWNAMVSDGDNGLFFVASWLKDLCLLYWKNDHCWNPAEKAEMADFCHEAGEYLYLDRGAYDGLFSNRLSIFNAGVQGPEAYSYVNTGANFSTGTTAVISDSEGNLQLTYDWKCNSYLNNRRLNISCAAALCGLVADNAKLIRYGKYCWYEVMAFFLREDGLITELYRSADGGNHWASKGLGYALTALEYVTFGHVLARLKQDYTLFTYTTRAMLGATQWPNPNTSPTVQLGTVDKGLAFFICSLGKYFDGTFQFYGQNDTDNAVVGNIAYLIDGVNRGVSPVTYLMQDTSPILLASNYYRQFGHPMADEIEAIGLRTRPGIYPYPPNSQIQNTGSLSGARAYTASITDAHFMFAGLNGLGVNLY